MTDALVWVDGTFEAPDGRLVRTDDRGFTLGDGLFETLRVQGGRAFRLEEHIDRLRRGAQHLHIPVPPTLEPGVEAVLERRRSSEGALRITLTRGVGPPGLDPRPCSEPTLVISLRSIARSRRSLDGLRVIIGGGRVAEGGLTSGMKTLGYGERIAALHEAVEAGADDALLLNGSGHVVGSSAGNVLVISDGMIRTPTDRCGPLPGITREVVLTVAQRSGIPFERAPLAPADLADADEIVLTSSLRGVAPVVSLDGRAVGSGAPGPLWYRLRAAYEEVVRQETRCAG